MAALQTIRNRAGLLVSIIIGLALITFILDPTTLEAFTRGDVDNLGEIYGEKISRSEYEREKDAFIQQYESQTRRKVQNSEMGLIYEQAWNSILQRKIYDQVFENLGLQVGSAEVFDMVQGQHISPFIRQQFTNPETGIFDKQAVIDRLKNVDPTNPQDQQFMNAWLNVEKNLQQQRLGAKFMNLMTKSLVTTKADAENSLAKEATTVNFNFVKIPLSQLKAQDVKVEDAEITNYFNENKSRYTSETEKRNLSYVEFPIEASQKDLDEVAKEFEELVAEFKASEKPFSFARLNSKDKQISLFQRKSDLKTAYKSLFSAPVGTFSEAQFKDNRHAIATVVATKVMADSVKLLALSLPAEKEVKVAEQKGDSLLKIAKSKKVDFEKLVADNGAKEAKSDIGWVNLKRLAKSSFKTEALKATKNQVFMVSENGSVNIFKVVDKTKAVKQVKLAELALYVDPSQETVKNLFNQASQFATENRELQTYLANTSAYKQSALGVEKMSYKINGLNDSRQIVRAAFDATEYGQLIDRGGKAVFETEDKYIVAYLTNRVKANEASLAAVKDEIKIELQGKKRANQLVKEISKADKLEAYAAAHNSEVKQAESVKFNSFYIPNLGVEPNLVAQLFKLDKNVLSQPIAGNDGAYIVEVTEHNKPETSEELIRSIQQNGRNARISELEIFTALKETAELVDNRYNYY